MSEQDDVIDHAIQVFRRIREEHGWTRLLTYDLADDVDTNALVIQFREGPQEKLVIAEEELERAQDIDAFLLKRCLVYVAKNSLPPN